MNSNHHPNAGDPAGDATRERTMAKKKKEKKFQREKLQKDLQESAHKIWLAGLGALSAATEEGSRFFQTLVERGEDVETKGRKSFDKARDEVESQAKKARRQVESSVDDLWEKVDERLTDAMHRFGVPTREEIHSLTRRVEELNAKIDTLKTGGTGVGERHVYHVATHEDGWKVEIEGSSHPTSVHGTKEEAVNAAKELAKGRIPSQVIVHKKDGKFQNEFSFDAH
jgi:poly(hydroxyalkanoate) granule-associated protein